MNGLNINYARLRFSHCLLSRLQKKKKKKDLILLLNELFLNSSNLLRILVGFISFNSNTFLYKKLTYHNILFTIITLKYTF